MQLVAEYADEVAVLKDGRIIFQGTAPALFRQAELMREADLTLPPLAELGLRLGYPDLLTVEDWLEWADARSRIRMHEKMANIDGQARQDKSTHPAHPVHGCRPEALVHRLCPMMVVPWGGTLGALPSSIHVDGQDRVASCILHPVSCFLHLEACSVQEAL